MISEFGQDVFEFAFKVMNENKQLVYDDEDNEGSELFKILHNLKFSGGSEEFVFTDKEVVLKFIDYASVFIIQNNMAN